MLEGSILQKLVAAHHSHNKPLNLGVYYKNTLVALCHALEDFLLETYSKPLMIAAFQRGKWYLQEAERYGELASKAQHIAIMAAPDSGFHEHPTSQRANVDLVDLTPNDPVSQEWHLIVLSPSYSAMVLCQELLPEEYELLNGQPREDLERKFYGFWTFEPELVRETVELAIAHITGYDAKLAQQLETQASALACSLERHQQDDLGAVVARVIHYLQQSQQNLSHTEAQAAMLHAQDLDNNLASNEMQAFLRIAQMIDQADAANPNAAAEVTALVESMGQLLDLPAWQVKRLRLAAMLHRLAPLQGATRLADLKTPIQLAVAQKHTSLPKASVLRIMPQLQAIADIIVHQNEHWDGTGQPDGLGFDAIPLESRILGLAAYFQERICVYRRAALSNPIAQALSDCQQRAAQAFDPKLVEALELLAMGLQQGMMLEVEPPKIAAGLWLLEEESAQPQLAPTYP